MSWLNIAFLECLTIFIASQNQINFTRFHMKLPWNRFKSPASLRTKTSSSSSSKDVMSYPIMLSTGEVNHVVAQHTQALSISYQKCKHCDKKSNFRSTCASVRSVERFSLFGAVWQVKCVRWKQCSWLFFLWFCNLKHWVSASRSVIFSHRFSGSAKASVSNQRKNFCAFSVTKTPMIQRSSSRRAYE